MSIVKVKIQNKLLDKRADVLSALYLNRLTGSYRALLKSGKILERQPLPKDRSDEYDQLWEEQVFSQETTDVFVPYRGREGEVYPKKRLIMYFSYEGDASVREKMSNTDRERNERWANFHQFHQLNPDVDVIASDGKSTNKNKVGDARWEMHDLSEKGISDNDKKRLSLKMGNILIDAFDNDKQLFVQMCHGIGMSADVSTYGTDYSSLFNAASDRVSENPYLLEALLSSENVDYLLDIRQAIGKGVISQSSGSYWIGQDPIGATEDDLVRFFKVNEGKYALISNKKLNSKAEKKIEPIQPSGSSVVIDVVDEDTIEKKAKYPTQRTAWVRARRNEYANDPAKSELFEQRYKSVCERNGWELSTQTT